MNYIVTPPQQALRGKIDPPTSKSISNRVLIIAALCDESFWFANISDSDDTKVMMEALEADEGTIDIGHAGTAMRFLTAYLSCFENKTFILTGSERMQNRPIGVLVDALRTLGAQIDYVEKEGYPPLKITGKKLINNYVAIDGSVSSQYISALLLIAPTLPNGLTIELKNELVSQAYIGITTGLMKHFGVHCSIEANKIVVPPQKYEPNYIMVEADWSGISYWYEIVALSKEAEIEIIGLQENSLQGDAIVSQLFASLGVTTTYAENSIIVSKEKNVVLPAFFEFDFGNNPDIAQTLAVTLCFLRIPFVFKGLKTLKIKETNRILALQNELGKFGYVLTEPNEGELAWNGEINQQTHAHKIEIATYNDHRMAMSFAPAALICKSITIQNAEVVAKSYPQFWADLQQVGFTIKEKNQ